MGMPVPDHAAAPAIEVPALDLTRPRRVHIVGVGGVGMSAIALLLARMGHEVSGSDLKESVALARLAAAGVRVNVGNHAANVPRDADAVVYSTAIPARNVELVAARELGISVLHRSAALAALAATRRTIAVAGSHGKTTTSSMLALMLRSAGWHPSFVIGGEVNEVGANAAYGDGEWLVVEADESDGTFLKLGPEAAIVTSVEPDHLEYYGGFDALAAAFERFVDGVVGPVVCCADDHVAARIANLRPRIRTYGFDPSAYYQIIEVEVVGDVSRFVLTAGGARLGDLVVPLGVKAATNAAGASAAGVGARRPVRRDRRSAPRFRRRGPEVRAAWRARRRDLRGRLRAFARRSGRRDRDPRVRAAGNESSWCSSLIGIPESHRFGATSPARSTVPMRSC